MAQVYTFQGHLFWHWSIGDVLTEGNTLLKDKWLKSSQSLGEQGFHGILQQNVSSIEPPAIQHDNCWKLNYPGVTLSKLYRIFVTYSTCSSNKTQRIMKIEIVSFSQKL